MQDEQKKNEEQIEEELNFEKPSFIFAPKGAHVYLQQGYYLVCESCPLKHAIYIGPDKVMVGEKDGQPILKSRKEAGLAS